MAIDIVVRAGRQIRYLRTQMRWTQSMLADHADLSREHLSEIERGKKEIGLRTLERVVNALNSDLVEFFASIISDPKIDRSEAKKDGQNRSQNRGQKKLQQGAQIRVRSGSSK